MKKIIILILVVVIAYQLKPDLFSFIGEKGAFDDSGKPLTLVFIHDKCGKPCGDAISLLKTRHVDFNAYKLDGNEANLALWKEHGGVNSFPNIIVGKEKVYGSYKSNIVSALALNYGDVVLTSAERHYMKKHFYDDGRPRLVMYSASWCGYCKKLREALNADRIDFVEIDVEKSSQRKAMTQTLDISGYPLVYYGYKRMNGPGPRDVLALF